MDRIDTRELKYRIHGDNHQIVVLHLDQGQCVFSRFSDMVWMDENIGTRWGRLRSRDTKPGLFGIRYHETIDVDFFMAEERPGRVAFSPSFPGRIIAVRLDATQSLITLRDSFLCGQDSCFWEKSSKQLHNPGRAPAGEVVLQRITGPGVFFLMTTGECTVTDLTPGQRVRFSLGHVAAFEETVGYEVPSINVNARGLGRTPMAVLTGPGRVWLQHHSLRKAIGALSRFMPRGGVSFDGDVYIVHSDNDGGDGGDDD